MVSDLSAIPLTTVLCVLTGGFQFQSTEAHAQTITLSQLDGRDFSKQRPSRDELSRLHQLAGSLPKGYIFEPDPWHVWKLMRGGETRYVLLLVESEKAIPGGSSACVQLFDAAEKRIGSWCFQTGWRITPRDAYMEYSSELASDLMVIRTSRFINGRNIDKEYFAFSGDQLRLIRLEDDQGEIVQNDYIYPNYEIGLVPDAKTAVEWIELLKSKNKPDVLSALVFLGGRHIVEPQRNLLPGPHDSRYAELFQHLVSTMSIRELIEVLCKSDDEWIKQAAVLAARGPRERLLH
ncbi:MAG TPA: hypothetical protein VEU96_31285 [Bryobacteraceae bacterium]|nr:hypothetical protein [Bryobacteraceae bacterium]